MSKRNSTMQLQVTLNGVFSNALGSDGKDKVIETRDPNYEAMIRKALDEGYFAPGKGGGFRKSAAGNITCSTGAIPMDLITCDKRSPKETEPKATKAEIRKALLKDLAL